MENEVCCILTHKKQIIKVTIGYKQIVLETKLTFSSALSTINSFPSGFPWSASWFGKSHSLSLRSWI